jgi:MFS family permease
MQETRMPERAPQAAAGVLIACAVLCAALAMGLRNTFGLFLAPMTEAHAWTASGFAFAIALQILLNGVFQPLCGQLADRFGGRAVIIGGALLYAVGTLGMAASDDLAM